MRSARDVQGYAEGRKSVYVVEQHRYEVLKAVREWKAAETDHAHTSFYGLAYIRRMRAFWLGVLRRQRELDEGWHTHHDTTKL